VHGAAAGIGLEVQVFRAATPAEINDVFAKDAVASRG
jgi:hypothetical protein